MTICRNSLYSTEELLLCFLRKSVFNKLTNNKLPLHLRRRNLCVTYFTPK